MYQREMAEGAVRGSTGGGSDGRGSGGRMSGGRVNAHNIYRKTRSNYHYTNFM